MGCFTQCVKYMFFLLNLVFMITGSIVLLSGIIVFTSYSDYSEFTELSFAPVLMIAIGLLVVLVALIGCLGACGQNSGLMITFAVLLFIIIASEIGIGFIGYFKQDRWPGDLYQTFGESLKKYEHDKNIQMSWKYLQTELACCGIDGPKDWEVVFNNSSLPVSCCREMPVINTECTKEHSFQNGCVSSLYRYLNYGAHILAGIGLGAAVFQILAILFACILTADFSHRYQIV